MNHSVTRSRPIPRCFRFIARVAVAVTTLLAWPAAAEQQVIHLYNWEDYLPEAIVNGFREKTGWQVEQVYYESDELKDELLLMTEGEGLDLVIGSAASFRSYVAQGLFLSPLPESIGQQTFIEPRWYAIFPELKDYAVPYLWGTLGIAYRKDKVPGTVTSWASLIQPAPALRGRIQMIEDMRELFTPALKLLGGSTNESDVKRIRRAGSLLKAQKPFVRTYTYIDITEKSELVTGTTWMALAYNGDAITLHAINPNIAYVVPQEGTNLWLDMIAMLGKSRHKDIAAEFIRYINLPENAALIAETLHYASPNRLAQKHLSPSTLNDPLIYPPKEILDKSEMIRPLTGDAALEFSRQYSHLIE